MARFDVRLIEIWVGIWSLFRLLVIYLTYSSWNTSWGVYGSPTNARRWDNQLNVQVRNCKLYKTTSYLWRTNPEFCFLFRHGTQIVKLKGKFATCVSSREYQLHNYPCSLERREPRLAGQVWGVRTPLWAIEIDHPSMYFCVQGISKAVAHLAFIL